MWLVHHLGSTPGAPLTLRPDIFPRMRLEGLAEKHTYHGGNVGREELGLSLEFEMTFALSRGGGVGHRWKGKCSPKMVVSTFMSSSS